MIRNILAAVVLGGALTAGAYVFACDGSNAHAAADTSDSDCDKKDCDKKDCDRSKATTVADNAPADASGKDCHKAKTAATTVATAVATTAPADASDSDCHKAKTASSTVVLASNAKTLHVENATCGSCIVPIREQLAAIKGIKEITSGEDYKDVIVTFTDDAKVTDAQLIAAVKEAGYTAVIKAAAEPAKQS